jgi:hypothetical protein
MDDDKTRRHVLVAIMSFCVVIILYMLAAMMLSRGGYVGFWNFVLAVFLGSLAGGAGFAVAHFLDL